ncbi:MAG TPA: DUF5615 family PIN-like protein [Phenylobacterium sp.]|nr:DUF5615 family PIN-like protein [Phenylobacterium sp.]
MRWPTQAMMCWWRARPGPELQIGSWADLAFEQGRVIVCEDFDFGDLAVRDKVPMIGVILVACPNQTIHERAARLLEVVADLGDRLLGALTRVETRRVRQRPLV